MDDEPRILLGSEVPVTKIASMDALACGSHSVRAKPLRLDCIATTGVEAESEYRARRLGHSFASWRSTPPSARPVGDPCEERNPSPAVPVAG